MLTGAALGQLRSRRYDRLRTVQTGCFPVGKSLAARYSFEGVKTLAPCSSSLAAVHFDVKDSHGIPISVFTVCNPAGLRKGRILAHGISISSAHA